MLLELNRKERKIRFKEYGHSGLVYHGKKEKNFFKLLSNFWMSFNFPNYLRLFFLLPFNPKLLLLFFFIHSTCCFNSAISSTWSIRKRERDRKMGQWPTKVRQNTRDGPGKSWRPFSRNKRGRKTLAKNSHFKMVIINHQNWEGKKKKKGIIKQ